MKKLRIWLPAILVALSLQAYSQDDAAELAKKLSNPISSLISVPFQNNTDYGIGDLKGTRNTLNIQPVVPLSLSPKLNLIARVVMPVIAQHNITGVGESQSGLSDFVLSGFLSPAEAKNGLTWGAGPVFLLPVGSKGLTTKKFGIGPTIVILKQTNGFTFGALANQIWSISGDEDYPDVSQMFLQPFVSYNWKSGAGFGINMEYTQNWKASVATIYLHPIITGVTSLGHQKVQLGFGPRFNLAGPSGSKASMGWRALAVFLFPK